MLSEVRQNPISTRYLIHDGHMDVFKLILMQMQHPHSYKVRNLLK